MSDQDFEQFKQAFQQMYQRAKTPEEQERVRNEYQRALRAQGFELTPRQQVRRQNLEAASGGDPLTVEDMAMVRGNENQDADYLADRSGATWSRKPQKEVHVDMGAPFEIERQAVSQDVNVDPAEVPQDDRVLTAKKKALRRMKKLTGM